MEKNEVNGEGALCGGEVTVYLESEGTERKEKVWGGWDAVQSEYGGLVLGADGALGIFGVQDPGGAALSIHVHRLHLKHQGGRHYWWM